MRFHDGMQKAKTVKKRVKRKEAQAVETAPDAWERFRQATHKVAPPRRPKPKSDEESDKP